MNVVVSYATHLDRNFHPIMMDASIAQHQIHGQVIVRWLQCRCIFMMSQQEVVVKPPLCEKGEEEKKLQSLVSHVLEVYWFLLKICFMKVRFWKRVWSTPCERRRCTGCSLPQNSALYSMWLKMYSLILGKMCSTLTMQLPPASTQQWTSLWFPTSFILLVEQFNHLQKKHILYDSNIFLYIRRSQNVPSLTNIFHLHLISCLGNARVFHQLCWGKFHNFWCFGSFTGEHCRWWQLDVMMFLRMTTSIIMDCLQKTKYRIISAGFKNDLFLYYIVMIILLELLEFRWVCPPR